MASVTSLGDWVQASMPTCRTGSPLPAAMEYVMPAAIELRTAVSISVLGSPPMLRLATAGLTAFLVTQSMPAAIVASSPEPLHLMTRTATIWTFLSTPKLVPPIVPATCVPCPVPTFVGSGSATGQSSATASLSTKSKP